MSELESLHLHRLQDVIDDFAHEVVRTLAPGCEADASSVRLTDLVIEPDLEGERNRRTVEEWNGPYRFSSWELWKGRYIPHANRPGVYIFFKDDGEAVYVGKAGTDEGIGIRVDAHFEKLPGLEQPKCRFENATQVVAIPCVSRQKEPLGWLAPALEGYLLSRFSFPENKNRR